MIDLVQASALPFVVRFVVRAIFEKACFPVVFKRFRIVVPPLIFRFSVTPSYTKTYENYQLLQIPQSSTTIRAIFADPVDT